MLRLKGTPGLAGGFQRSGPILAEHSPAKGRRKCNTVLNHTLGQMNHTLGQKRDNIYSEINRIYHDLNGVIGHRSMKVFLDRNGIHLSFTSVEFITHCKGLEIMQSISYAGCPYDNPPIERYYNTLKAELIPNTKNQVQNRLKAVDGLPCQPVVIVRYLSWTA